MGWRPFACGGWWAAKRARQCLTLAVAAVGGTLLLVVQLPHRSLLQDMMPRITLPPSEECPAAPVISAHSAGRLGNNLAEYATIYALGLRYNLTAVATPSLLRFIRHVSPNTTLPVVSDACAEQHSPILVGPFEELSDEERRAHSWRIDQYPHHVRLFWRYRHQLRDEFAIRPDLFRDAQLQLLNVSRGRTGLTFVGVHVRRTDYASHLKVNIIIATVALDSDMSSSVPPFIA
ncbi:galactoside alpha-(1,2)-fucosyltransferase 1-like [Pollicipes pollicipes]|uniref:galactoside alpha-(1,2)-fucosyltransferase 1-like n=1 Tax=Pollicipes pollicipes TaxID=41117 RepID=UPI001884A78E|nr:galactoside alpha-(1,2)-fucosyltransferase 1-like [Pollicipes pollicipes]